MPLIDGTLDAKVQGQMAEATLSGPINPNTVMPEEAKAIPFIIKSDQIRDTVEVHDACITANAPHNQTKQMSRTLS